MRVHIHCSLCMITGHCGQKKWNRTAEWNGMVEPRADSAKQSATYSHSQNHCIALLIVANFTLAYTWYRFGSWPAPHFLKRESGF